ncbi:MAG TPA: VCBS repeat-containing protein [Verrucomicrobiae bacterium]|jgi:hypothetical protein|nr:VCBS repeat-containing protein [Verrucomicrobiae bacterium]
MKRHCIALLGLISCLFVVSNNSARAQSIGFMSATYSPPNASPTSLVVADVNGDGYPDVILGNGTSDTIFIFTNNGVGIFASNSTIQLPNAVYGIAAVDVNGEL